MGLGALDRLLLRLTTVTINGVVIPVPNPTATQSSPTPPTNLNIIGTGISGAFNAATGSYDVTITAGGVAVVTNANYTLTATTGIWSIFFTGLTGAVKFIAPAAPTVGMRVTLSTDSATSSNTVAFDPSGNTLAYSNAGTMAAAASKEVVFQKTYESATWEWNGSLWMMVSIVPHTITSP